MILVHIQPHTRKLLLQLLWGALTGIRQKQKTLVLIVKPLHKFLYTRQQPISMIDHTIHIADEAFFIP